MRAHGHARVATILASTVRVPVLTAVAQRRSREPVVETRFVAGTTAAVVRPRDEAGCAPTVFLNGATPLGCQHPAARRSSPGSPERVCSSSRPRYGGCARAR